MITILEDNRGNSTIHRENTQRTAECCLQTEKLTSYVEFGTGLTRFVNETIKRGAIGKSVKALNKWWNRTNIERGQVLQAKELRLREKEDNRNLELQFQDHERFTMKRNDAIRRRELGLEYSDTYGLLPPVRPYVQKESLYS
eukprot:gene1434-1521_t